MKILFFLFYPATPHLDTDLELICTHLVKGDEVFIMKCNEDLKTCTFNFHHYKHLCFLCKYNVKTGLNRLPLPAKNVFNMPFKEQKLPDIPSSFANIEELQRYIYDGMPLGRAAAANLITFINVDYKINTVRHRAEVNRQLKTALNFYKTSLEILKKKEIQHLIIFNGRFCESAVLIAACEKLGIPYTTHERAGKLGKYVLCPNTLPHDFRPNYQEMCELWDVSPPRERQKIGERFFLERRGGIDQGWYSYVKSQREGQLPKNFNDYKKKIVFFNNSMEEFSAVTRWIPYLYTSDNECLQKMANSLLPEKEIHIYLRVHPHLKGFNNTQIREIREMGRKYPNLTIIPPDSPIHSYTLMDNCDIICTFVSTIGIEAVFWGKPSVLTGHAAYDGVNCVYKPRSHEELIELLKSQLPPLDRTDAIKYGFWEMTRGIPYRLFTHTAVSKGAFLGVPLWKPPLYGTFIAYMWKILDILKTRKLKDLKNTVLNTFRKQSMRIGLFPAPLKPINQ